MRRKERMVKRTDVQVDELAFVVFHDCYGSRGGKFCDCECFDRGVHLSKKRRGLVRGLA